MGNNMNPAMMMGGMNMNPGMKGPGMNNMGPGMMGGPGHPGMMSGANNNPGQWQQQSGQQQQQTPGNTLTQPPSRQSPGVMSGPSSGDSGPHSGPPTPAGINPRLPNMPGTMPSNMPMEAQRGSPGLTPGKISTIQYNAVRNLMLT